MSLNGKLTVILMVLALGMTACGTAAREQEAQIAQATASALEAYRDSGNTVDASAAPSTTDLAIAPEADVSFTLKTGTGPDGLAFVGVGGDIDDVANPVLSVSPGDTVSITVVNGDNVTHDFAIDEFNVKTPELTSQDQSETVTFTVDETGSYSYYCAIPGHRAGGMEGVLQVGEPEAATAAEATDIVHDPSDLPGPIDEREPEVVKVDLEAVELEGQLADGTTYTYFTFNGHVPGPFIRVQVGDTVELTLTNRDDSNFPHSIDLHAVNGPGGGAVYTQTNPGESNTFSFKTLTPGLFVYHCATPSVPHHIAQGMYGLILVEPEGGLPPVDREFYVMQGEIYTLEPFGTSGHLNFSEEKMLSEDPEYFVFNGAANALASDEHALRANVGETVRIFFGVGGPNATSSFHVIGEIFDRAYPFASLSSPPLQDVQTITVAPGGATMVEFTLDVPGRYILVDHALSRLERGLAGFLYAEGDENPEIFTSGPALTDQ